MKTMYDYGINEESGKAFHNETAIQEESMDLRQRIRITILLGIVLASLFGCGVDLDTTATTTNPPTETTATTSQTETITEPSPLMSEGPDYAITDLAIGYMFASPVMKTYFNASDPKTAYVDIEECMVRSRSCHSIDSISGRYEIPLK